MFPREVRDAALSDLGAAGRRILILATVLGAALRVAYQHGRPFLGDEVGTLDVMRNSVAAILSTYGPWISMNYFLLAEKGLAEAFGTSAWVLTALPLAGSVATIPLTAGLAIRIASPRAAAWAACLVALNPYLVGFGPVIRSYSLVAAFALATVILFLRWRARPAFARGLACAAAGTVLCLLHLVGVYVVAGIATLVALDLATRLREADARAHILAAVRTLAVPFLIGGAALALAYARLVADIRTTNAQWTASPPTSVDYLPHVFSSYFGAGFAALVPGALLLSGTWTAIRERRPILALLVLCAVPVGLMSWQGVDHVPWAYARFLIFTLPFLLVVAAAGTEGVVDALPEARRRWGTLAVAILVAASWIPGLRSRFAEKSNWPWVAVAEHVQSLPPPATVVVPTHLDALHLWPMWVDGGAFASSMREFLRAPEPAGRARLEVAYVNAREPIATDAPALSFGRIQVITYAGATKREVLARLRSDLVRATGGRTGPQFDVHYKVLTETSEHLGLANDAQTFRLLQGWSRQYRLRQQALHRRESLELEEDDAWMWSSADR